MNEKIENLNKIVDDTECDLLCKNFDYKILFE